MANFTRAQYDLLIEAMSSGTKEVRYSDKTVVYRTFDEMRQLKAMMEDALGLNSNGDSLPNQGEGITWRKGRRIADFHDSQK